MKKFFTGIVLVALLFAIALSAEAKTIRVKSYFKPSIGKYINSFYKTSPNKTKFDNYSTKGNYNPYTPTGRPLVQSVVSHSEILQSNSQTKSGKCLNSPLG